MQSGWQEEYELRAKDNVAACEKISGEPMSENDQQTVGLMVYRQMQAERKLGIVWTPTSV